MDSCPSCGLKLSDPSLTPSFCPNCGERLREEALPSAPAPRKSGLIGSYFQTVWRILTRPSEFFRSMPTQGGVSGPLAFALVTHWLGEAVSYLWRTLIGGAIGDSIQSFMNMATDVAEIDSPGRTSQLTAFAEQLRHWFWGIGTVVADPFLTLFRILFISFFVYLGARLFVSPGRDGAPRRIDFETALRIICFGLTPSILAVLPLFGTVISYLYVVVVTVIGVREVYRIGTMRALLVAFFPQFLLIGLICSVLMVIFLAVAKIFMTTFSL